MRGVAQMTAHHVDKFRVALYARANDPFGKVGRVQVATDVSSVIRASSDFLPGCLDGAPLREWRPRRNRTLDRNFDHRGRAPARRGAPAQKSARCFYPCHQLVEGTRLMRLKSLSTILIASCSLAACATFKPPLIDYDRDPAPAVLDTDPPRPVKVVALRTPLPLPGQLKPLPAGKPAPEPKDPTVRVATANEAARVQPTRDGYINAVQVYPFMEGALYQVYTAPGRSRTSRSRKASARRLRPGRRRRHRPLDHRRYGKRHWTLEKSAYSRQTHAAGPHDQSRHQHRPADLSARAQIGGENLYGLCLLAISAGPAHCVAPAECGSASGCADPERYRYHALAVPLRDRGRRCALASGPGF